MNSPTAYITVRVNGEARRLAADCSIEQLLESLDMAGQRVAVERNEDVVPRSEYATTQLQQDDRIEIIRAIGGG